MAMMEMNNAKANQHRGPPPSDRHHVRNLWPPVGGGLPGGKPIQPTAPVASFTPVMQKQKSSLPPHYYDESTSYATNKSAVPANANNGDNGSGGICHNIFESSQVRPDPSTMAANNAIVPPAAPLEYVNHYDRPPMYIQPHPMVPSDSGRWYPFSIPPPPLLSQPSFETSRYYRPDPTTMVNQVSYRLTFYVTSSRTTAVVIGIVFYKLTFFVFHRERPNISFPSGIYTDQHRTFLQSSCRNR